MGRLISEKYAAWQAECEERFQRLKKNEEELNRIFIDIYGLQDELTPDVADKDVTVHRVFDSKDDVPESMKGSNYVRTMRDEIVSLISYAVGCMFGRYSLDVDGLAYAGGEWDASKYKTIIPDGDNIIPICDDEYFDDDITGRFVEFIRKVYGDDTLEENLRSDEAMAVFRVERNKGYTVMSNHHLRNKELSLKAKGLLSQMLSLPEDWDYTLSGLSYINRESIDAIRTAVWELEKAGYITRRQGRDEKGKMTAIEYTIYEQPQPPELDCPVLENPTADNPILENPTTDNPTSENPTQLNKDIQRTNLPKKEQSNTDLSSTHSIPIHSLKPLPYGEDETAQPPERKRTERNDAYRVYEEIIKDNIAYDILLQDRSLDRDRLNEIVDLMLETVCTARKKIRIAGDDYPAELVKSKFMKLNSEHIRFVLDCMQENTTKIRNIKQYLKAVLFNAPSTIDSYYTSLVAHDMASGALAPRKPKYGDLDYYTYNEGESL